MNYSDMTVAELRAEAKKREGITGYSKMKKDDIINALIADDASSQPVIEVQDEFDSVPAAPQDEQEGYSNILNDLPDYQIPPEVMDPADYPRNRHERRKARAMQKKMLGKFKARLHARGIKV